MPASYAHYRFGRMLLPELPADVHQCVQHFRRMYDVGLQGPDFFFYYNPLMKTKVGALGEQFHSQTGKEFFGRCAATVQTEAGLAYLYGLLGHYTLDSVCHPFVDKMANEGKARHVALESEFDRYLMAADGIANPAAYSVSDTVKLTRGECVTAAAFFPPATAGNVSRGVRFMSFALKFLAGDRKKREKLLRRVGSSLTDSLVPEAPVPEYARMIQELEARFAQSLRLYPELLAQLEACRREGIALGEDFAPTFETGRN